MECEPFLRKLQAEVRKVTQKHCGKFKFGVPLTSPLFGSIKAVDWLFSIDIQPQFLYPITMKNLCGKTRKVNEPYEVWRNGSGWEWRILKKWQAPDKEPTIIGRVDVFARWFCAVKSPMTHGSYDLGDVYVLEVIRNAVKVEFDPATLEKW